MRIRTSGLLRRHLAVSLAASLLLGLGPIARAQAPAYPGKPIKVVVPAGPGSTADILVRIVSDRMAQSGKQAFVIDHRPGAGGIIGADAVAKAGADGYTLLFTANNFIIAPSLFPTRVPYIVTRDFMPVGLVAAADNLIVAAPDKGLQSVKNMVDAARGSPNGLDYSSPLLGSAAHLTMEMLGRSAGIKLTHVPFKEASQAMAETLAGRVPLTITGIANAAPHIKSGKLVPIAVTGSRRSSFLPNVPTLTEAGVPGVDVALWFALYAPARTPAPVIEWLNRELNAALNAPEVREKLAAQSFEVLGGTPVDLAELMKRQQPQFARIISEADIKVD
jgi:tripartite-type tricarboxylate transporter receptor subunit TctC